MNTNSPQRSAYLTQRRQARDSTLRYPQLSQKSPLINSPNLNEQTQPEHHFKGELNTDLKLKLDLVLKHNSQLLNENATLSEMVNSLRMQLEMRQRNSEHQHSKTTTQIGTIMIQMKQQASNHESELQRLLGEISKLHDECHQIQIDKNMQMRRMQEAHQRQMVQQIAQIKRSIDDGRSLTDLQIRKLKETIEMRQFQLDSFKAQAKSQLQQSKTHAQLLQNELDHNKKLRDLELQELSKRNKDDMRSALRQMELQKNLEIKQYENKIIKLRKDLSNKDMELEQVSKKTSGDNEEIYLELSSIKKEKQYLLQEIQAITEISQQKIAKEKERIAQLADLEKQNMGQMFQNQKESLIGQKNKLLMLCVEKSEEIKRLYENIEATKQTHEAEKNQLNSLLDNLRHSLRESERSTQEQLELLKIKMSQLHDGDIKSLQTYYEHEVLALHTQINTLREAQKSDREKIYTMLQENDDLRKNFEVQISKQKAKIQDMKVKFAAARLEFKEQITSLGTKMQLTSQTLVRETEQKQKGSEFFEAEKRKFYQIIQAKDKQTQSIHETMIRLKEINEEEINMLKSQVNMLRDSLINKQNEFKDFKSSLQQEYQRKSMKMIEENKPQLDQQGNKENHELKQKMTELEKETFKKQKQIQFLTRQNKSLQQQLGLRAGFIETMQLQSCAAIEDEKTKVRLLMGKNEVAMKDYYEVKLASREQDNEALRKQIHEKQTDLRSLITKYNHLERRLRELLEAQNKLTDFENKIIHLGIDQNLIKNVAQLFAKKK